MMYPPQESQRCCAADTVLVSQDAESFVALQFPCSPMRLLARLLARRVEHPLNTPMEGSQHPDARMHQEVTAFGGADQTPDSGLPFHKILLSLRKLHHIIGGVLQRNEPAAAGQGDWIIERPFPALRKFHQQATCRGRVQSGGMRTCRSKRRAIVPTRTSLK
jgi:hypothetical protein